MKRSTGTIAAILLAGFAAPAASQLAVLRTTGVTAEIDPVASRQTIPLGPRSDSVRDLRDPLESLLLGGTRHSIPIRVSAVDRRRADRARQEVSTLVRSVDYSGPRFGITYLPRAAVDSLKNHSIDVSPTITQFGWQLEHEIHVSADGPRILNEWVFLAGGLESGVFLPSLTWLIGARDRSGNEIGVGPNASVAGVGLAAAAGVTIHDGGVNFPMNIAVAKSKTGARVSFLTGFTIH